ncbi:EamA family transporter [Candidatus Gottesmanbacteria bacterium]|nr:EamA family transporter [Candidatus Gottesmanbacteria bacterium]
MNWIGFSIIAIGIVGISDIFRKLASNLKDPFFTNLIFQTAASITTIITFLIFSRNVENDPKGIIYAILGGVTIATFSLFSFKALSTGPGVSVVMPVLRIGGISFLVLLGIIFLKEKISIQTITGLLFSAIGIFLLFTNK